MLELQTGIQIFYPDRALETKPRVWLSSGTALASQTVPDCDHYCPGAFVPRLPWREPTAVEQDRLWAETPPPRELGVGIVQVPSSILDVFMAAEIGSASTPQDAKSRINQKCETAIAQLVDFFTPFSLTGELPVVNGIGARQPGLWTSTRDLKRDCRNGLHTDSWDQLALAEKHRATNRICVNLGCEDRYFLFINLPEIVLSHYLNQSDLDALHKPWRRDLTEAFMTRYPDYPVIKLGIAPGEAYIAPTENMIHDATTLEKQHLDIKIMLRGHYRLCSIQA